MRGADRRVQPIRPTVRSARDRQGLPQRALTANADWATIGSDLEAISAGRPEVATVIRGIVSVALELTLMLPRQELERFLEHVIERLDDLDGDPDLEPVDEREPDYG